MAWARRSGPFASWGAATSNYGLGFDDAGELPYGYDDDTQELIIMAIGRYDRAFFVYAPARGLPLRPGSGELGADDARADSAAAIRR